MHQAVTPGFFASLTAAIVCTAALGSGDPVRLLPKQVDGAQTEWTLDRTTEWEVATARASSRRVTAEVSLAFETKVAGQTAESIQFECRVADVKMKVTADTTTVSFERNAPQEMKSTVISPALLALLDTPIRFDLLRTGEIGTITGLPDSILLPPERSGMRQAVESVVSEASWKSLLTNLYGVGGGRESAEPDDSWAYGYTRPLVLDGNFANGIVELSAHCTLLEVRSGGSCSVTLKPEVKVTAMQPGGPTWSAQIASAQSNASLTIDAKNGEIVENSSKWSLDFTATPTEGLSQRGSIRESTVIRRGAVKQTDAPSTTGNEPLLPENTDPTQNPRFR